MRIFQKSRTWPLFCHPQISRRVATWLVVALGLFVTEWAFSSHMQSLLFASSSPSNHLFMVLVTLLGFRVALSFSSSHLFHSINAHVNYILRAKWSEVALRSRLDTISSSKLQHLLSESVVVAGLGVSTLMQAFFHGLLVFLYASLCLYLHPSLFGLASLGFLVILPVAIWCSRKGSSYGKARTKSMRGLNQVLSRAKLNQPYLVMMRLQDSELDRIHKENERVLNAHLGSDRVQVFLHTAPQGFGYLFIFMLCSFAWKSGHTENLLVFTYILLRFFQSVSVTWSAWGSFRSFRHSLQEACECFRLNVDKEQLGPESKQRISRISIRMERLFLPDGRQRKILGGPFDMELSVGKSLLIQGASGSGKSTLLNCVCGLSDEYQGSILFNGKDHKAFLNSKQLAYAASDPYLIEGTVLDNLLYGHSSLRTGDALARVIGPILDLVGLEDWESESLLGKKISSLSHGESQRLALARALLYNPAVLMLDEATNGLDEPLEQKVIQNLKKAYPEMILIAVSHRSRVRPLFDKVLNLEERPRLKVISS